MTGAKVGGARDRSTSQPPVPDTAMRTQFVHALYMHVEHASK